MKIKLTLFLACIVLAGKAQTKKQRDSLINFLQCEKLQPRSEQIALSNYVLKCKTCKVYPAFKSNGKLSVWAYSVVDDKYNIVLVTIDSRKRIMTSLTK